MPILLSAASPATDRPDPPAAPLAANDPVAPNARSAHTSRRCPTNRQTGRHTVALGAPCVAACTGEGLGSAASSAGPARVWPAAVARSKRAGVHWLVRSP